MASFAAAPASCYRFADLTLDAGRRCVWRGAQQIRLSNLTFELLRVLVEQAPNVVAHDALADRTWGPHRIVTPENLAKRVMLLRQALGDDADQPRYIERVRCHGYRLIPDVEDATKQDAAVSLTEPQAAAEVSRPATRRARAFGKGALAAGVLLLVASAGWLAGERLPPREAVADGRSIAVLPFENRSVAEEDAGFFASGVHDDLVTRLAAIGDLWEREREGPDEPFDMTSAVVAVDGDTAVVRVEVHYDRSGNEFRDLWVIRFAGDGRCERFEEWPYWPGKFASDT